ncbi:MAG: hypothetical protein ACLQVI_34110 [Polyangiaceae bacterium]
MRPRAALLLASFASLAILVPGAARAEDGTPGQGAQTPPADAPAPDAAPDLARLLLDDGRVPIPPSESGLIRFLFHGEYQLRFNRMQSFPLDVSDTVSLAHPGTTVVSDSLGQNTWLNHWLRITPRLQLGKNVAIVGQMDIVTGVVMGDLTHDVSADQTPRDSDDGFSNVQPRWLYLEWLTPIGLIRAGQMGNQWGMGLVANDGDHPSLFGDYRYGSIGDGILFGTKPLGKDSPFTIALGGQFVFKDPLVDLSRGDRATQVVLASYLEKGLNQIGIYGAYRHQWNNQTSDSPLYTYADQIDVGVVDVAGKFASKIAGQEAWLVGSAEVATIFGNTNEIRTPDQAASGQKTAIVSYGGAAQIGVVHVAREAHNRPPPPESAGTVGEGSAESPVDWGDVVAQLEYGYASGDADPYGETQKRFTFDPNHKVGLLLFDEVMRWQTARAATAAQDPNLSNVNRPTPGVNLIPSNGGVFGAQYIYPTAIVRPRPWLDLKAGVVIAQATADVVDPYRTAVYGSSQNYLGGSPARHDLGVELDGGFEVRVPLDYGVKLALGAQAGVLFPGGALEDANGNKMHAPWIVVGRLGVTF